MKDAVEGTTEGGHITHLTLLGLPLAPLEASPPLVGTCTCARCTTMCSPSSRLFALRHRPSSSSPLSLALSLYLSLSLSLSLGCTPTHSHSRNPSSCEPA
jgi:hypothetical protein